MTIGIDISVYTGPIARAQLDCAKAQGAKYVIVGTQNHEVFIPQMREVLAAGLRLEAYIYLYVSRGPLTQVNWTIDRLEEAGLKQHVKRLWLDAESGFELPGDAEVTEIRRLYDRCRQRGLESGLYTGRWWWQPNVGNTAALKDVPLWYASYDGLSQNTWARDKFPGWDTWHTKQYTGSTDLCGMTVDMNYREVVEDATAGPDYESIVKRLWPEYLGLAFEQGWVNEVLKDRTTALAQRVLAIDELFREAGLR